MANKIRTFRVIEFNTNCPSSDNIFNPPTPGLIKSTMSQTVKQEVPVDFIICFLKIKLEYYSSFAFSLGFMESFM